MTLNKFNKNLKLIVSVLIVWMLVVSILGLWWGRVVIHQADQIVELQRFKYKENSSALQASQVDFLKTKRMLYWETLTFLFLLFSITAVLSWLYIRDYRRNKALQAFFASLTHELRTPLTSIRLQAETLAEIEGMSNDKRINRLLEDTSRLENQVNRTLELARIEGGGPIVTEPILLDKWLSKVIDNSFLRLNHKFEFSSEVPKNTFIMADPLAIEIIFKNLIENSIKHSQKELVKIKIKSLIEKNYLSIIYQDNGKGFFGHFSKLGNLFFKGPGSQGAGVGLYLVKSLMSRMSGDVRFYPSDTEGFFVKLVFLVPKDQMGELN